MPVDAIVAARIVALIEDGRGQRETARIVGKSLCAVQKVYRRYEETGLITRRQGSGRKRVTSQRDDRFLVSTSLRNRTASAVLLRNQLQEVRNVNVSEWTVRRRLHAAGLSCRRMATGPPLQRRHRIARLNFARNHVAWTVDDWARVQFSDESRFCLNGSDGRRRVWRRPGERYAQVCIDERLPFGGGSVMVWAGISAEARTELVFIENGSLTAHRYITQVLEDHAVPFMITMGERGIFMQDNARPHVARVVGEYLDEVGIRRFDWPALSPDLNPIEHVWDELGRRIRQHTAAPRTAQELRELLLQEWDNIEQNVIRNLTESMPRRLQAVINARGGNTQY